MTPWSTPITGYSNFDGIELPSAGSAVWAMPNTDFEYIQITISKTARHART